MEALLYLRNWTKPCITVPLDLLCVFTFLKILENDFILHCVSGSTLHVVAVVIGHCRARYISSPLLEHIKALKLESSTRGKHRDVGYALPLVMNKIRAHSQEINNDFADET